MLILLTLQLIQSGVQFSLTVLIQFGLISPTDVFTQQEVQTSLSNEAHTTAKCRIADDGLTNLQIGVVDALGRQVLHETRGGFLCALDTALRQTTFDVVGNVEFDCTGQGLVQTPEEFLDRKKFGQADGNADRQGCKFFARGDVDLVATSNLNTLASLLYSQTSRLGHCHRSGCTRGHASKATSRAQTTQGNLRTKDGGKRTQASSELSDYTFVAWSEIPLCPCNRLTKTSLFKRLEFRHEVPSASVRQRTQTTNRLNNPGCCTLDEFFGSGEQLTANSGRLRKRIRVILFCQFKRL